MNDLGTWWWKEEEAELDDIKGGGRRKRTKEYEELNSLFDAVVVV